MKKQKPFFAKFLENQITEQQSELLKGGDCLNTHQLFTRKYPSDWEDSMTHVLNDVDLNMTKKAPSDCEDE